MKTTQLHIKLKNLFLGLFSSALVLSCGSFQSASYYESDGIYVSKTKTEITQTPKKNNSSYYQQYFQNVADEGYVEPASDEIYFTDTDSYESTGQYYQNNTVEYGNSQIPWGEQTSRTEIVYIDNSPSYLWGLSGFAFNFSPFWNDYYANPYRFGYGRFNRSFYNYPYNGFGGFWGYDPFYSPFSYYGGFYNPYGFGFGYGYHGIYGNHWAHRYNRWNRFDDYYRSNFDRRNSRDYKSTVARVKSGRGEKNYNNSSQTRQRKQEQNSKNRAVQSTINRLNLGRGTTSLGGTSLVGYDRNRLGVRASSSNTSNARPRTNSISRNQNGLGLTQGNININKPSSGISINAGRVQQQYRLIDRNPNRSTTVRRNTNRSNEVERSSRRVTGVQTPYRGAPRQQRQSRSQNETIKNNSNQSRSTSYSRSNSSYSTNRSSSSSSNYNSGSSRSSYSSSGGRSSGTSRGSSGGGRRNK